MTQHSGHGEYHMPYKSVLIRHPLSEALLWSLALSLANGAICCPQWIWPAPLFLCVSRSIKSIAGVHLFDEDGLST